MYIQVGGTIIRVPMFFSIIIKGDVTINKSDKQKESRCS